MRASLSVIIAFLFISLGVTRSCAQETVSSCADVPAGYVITEMPKFKSLEYIHGCAKIEYKIKKADDMKSGATATVCSAENIPSGWAITGVKPCNCADEKCMKSNLLYTIKKLAGAAYGTTVTVCASSNIPAGWETLEESECNNCDAWGGIRYQWKIQKK
jgi:hypothetical protein